RRLRCFVRVLHNKSTSDIKRRISLAKQAFHNKNRFLTNKHLSIGVHKYDEIFVWSVLTYDSETWTMNKKYRSKLEATEMWMWRKTAETRWIDKMRNEQVLEEVPTREKQLMKIIESRKLKLVGHIIQHNDFIIDILKEK
ncbi:Hypothetical protein CINCED_3A004671, partial [Cinara cedri]